MRLRYFLLTQAFVVVATLGVLTLSGCNPFAFPILAAHVMGYGEEANVQFHFPKDAKRLAVVVHMSRHSQVEMGHFDRDVATYLAPKIHSYTEKKPDVIRITKVQKWMDEHPNWKTPNEIGRGLEADHVVFIEM